MEQERYRGEGLGDGRKDEEGTQRLIRFVTRS